MKSLFFAAIVFACSPVFAERICGVATHDSTSAPPDYRDNAGNRIGSIVGVTAEAEGFFNSYQSCVHSCAEGYKPYPNSKWFLVNYAECDSTYPGE